MMETIAQIDREITKIRRKLRTLEQIDPMSSASWHEAWKRHPGLQAQEMELFRQRGIAQQERDIRAAKTATRRARYKRPKKCPTCGQHTFRQLPQ